MVRAMCTELEATGGHEVSREEQLWRQLPEKVIEWLEEPGQHLVVAELPPGSVIGFGHCRTYRLGAAFRPRKLLHIGSLYVEPNYRNQGIGESIARVMLAWGKKQGCEACELNVLANNPAARLYKKLGFDHFQIQMKIDLV